jgi:hypothetical protein
LRQEIIAETGERGSKSWRRWQKLLAVLHIPPIMIMILGKQLSELVVMMVQSENRPS